MRRIDHVSLWPSTLDVTATVGHTKFALCQSTKCKFHSIGHTGQTYHVTLTFNLGGHGACHWCMSVSSICTPTLKFLCLTIPKIWHILCICISWPWPWTLNLKLVRNIAHVMGTIMPILVIIRLFIFDLWAIGPTWLKTDHVTLQSWPLTLEVTTPVTDAGRCPPSVYQVWSS